MAATSKEQIITIIYMFVIAVFFTAIVAAVNVLLSPRIEANIRVRELQGIFKAMDIEIGKDLPEDEVEERAAQGLRKVASEQAAYYCGLNEQGTIIALIFPVHGSGFWGPIGGYIGINPTDYTIINLTFVRHTETPGLGARITEEWFTDQFRGMALPDEGTVLRLVQEGKPKGPSDLDAITGATGTSAAVANMLNAACDTIRATLKEGVPK